MTASWLLALSLLVMEGDESQTRVTVAVVGMVVRKVLVVVVILCLSRLSVCSPFQSQQG